MIRYAVRAGLRSAARSGGPKGPPKPWSVPTRVIVAGVVLATWWAMNWHSLVITFVVLVFFVPPMCVLIGRSKQPKRDPLDTLMDAYRDKPEQRAESARDEYADPLARLQARYGIEEER
jgi:hypothetical protein